jgi:cytosine/adenosine deaminase-related metal-dependent hydrolase
MRIIQSSYIIPLNSAPIANGYLYMEDDGTIIHITKEAPITDQFKVEEYDGILCPGFINTHCHLELSHMKGMMTEASGLPAFVDQIPKQRQKSKLDLSRSIKQGDEEMQQSGIVAVGDISNTDATIEIKSESPIQYHSFVELFGLNKNEATPILNEGLQTLKKFEKNDLSASLVPHAPYSVSIDLLKGIYAHNKKNLLSMHHQETPSENELFLEGQGELADMLLKKGRDLGAHLNAGKNATEFSLTPYLSTDQKILLVHNTYSSASDINGVLSHFTNAYWCTCPKANWYIERDLPDYNLWRKKGLKITVGTDSLASNDSLSILEELKLIQNKFPNIPTHELLSWACKNGAEYFEFDSLGSFKAGNKPGVVLIEQVDGLQLTPESRVRVLSR